MIDMTILAWETKCDKYRQNYLITGLLLIVAYDLTGLIQVVTKIISNNVSEIQHL